MNNLLNLKERLEDWKVIYESTKPKNFLKIFSSNHGRLRIQFEKESVILDLVDSTRLSLSLNEKFGFSVEKIDQ